MTEDRRHNKQNREWARRIIDITKMDRSPEGAFRAIRGATRLIRDDHESPDPAPPPPLKPRPALPMRGDFLKYNVLEMPRQAPDHPFSGTEVRMGFRYATLQYLAVNKSARQAFRAAALQRGHTHMAVYIRSANDIKTGHFDYYNDPDHVIKCLTELVQDGLGPIVFLLDDEGRAFNQNIDMVRAVWKRNLPLWGHLCSVLVPGLECNEYWNLFYREKMFKFLRDLVPDAYIAGHFTADHYETHPEMDGILWQFDIWNHWEDEHGNTIVGSRRDGQNFHYEIARNDKLTGHSREWRSPARQAIADGKKRGRPLDFIAGEWTQLPTDGEEWGIKQSKDIERALLWVYDGDASRIGLMNGARK